MFAGKIRSLYNQGTRGSLIDASLANEAKQAAAILEGTGISLIEAARLAKAKAGVGENKETFAARYRRACDGMEGQWSEKYRIDMAKMLRWMPKELQVRPCSMIDRAAVVAALREKGFSQSTIDLRARMVMAVVNYRERHRKARTIHILDRDQQKSVLAACKTAGERRAVGLLLYAGIRPDAEHGEISRLEWSDITEEGIYVRAEASKTGSDRIVPIAPVLQTILEGHPLSGRVTPPNWRRAWQRIRKDAGISDMQDVLRHTFASHMLMWKGEDATKAAMGHTANSSTLFRHYRRAVTAEAAEEFFTVDPQ